MVSIHAFRGEGDAIRSTLITTPHVSIHAFRGEGDPSVAASSRATLRFNPRLPGGRRRPSLQVRALRCVSIHAFRGEGDAAPLGAPRCGGRFQSTPSGGKATWTRRRDASADRVSIHAFRGEGDEHTDERPGHVALVSIHAFRGEGDDCRATGRVAYKLFQSTPSGGKATELQRRLDNPECVSIHAFRGEGDDRTNPTI